MRARDLIEMIGTSSLIPLAAKYANKLGRIHLAEKLSEMMPRVMEMEREKETEMDYMEETIPSISQVSVIPSSMPSPVVVAPVSLHLVTTPKNLRMEIKLLFSAEID